MILDRLRCRRRGRRVPPPPPAAAGQRRLRLRSAQHCSSICIYIWTLSLNFSFSYNSIRARKKKTWRALGAPRRRRPCWLVTGWLAGDRWPVRPVAHWGGGCQWSCCHFFHFSNLVSFFLLSFFFLNKFSALRVVN